MKIRNVMSNRVWSVTKNQPIIDAVDHMDFHGVGAVPVVEDGRPIGILTDRDVALHMTCEAKPLRQCTVSEVMTWNPVCLLEDDDVEEAVVLMRRRRVRRIPIVRNDGRLAGMLSLSDLAMNLPVDQAGEILRRVSEGVAAKNRAEVFMLPGQSQFDQALA